MLIYCSNQLLGFNFLLENSTENYTDFFSLFCLLLPAPPFNSPAVFFFLLPGHPWLPTQAVGGQVLRRGGMIWAHGAKPCSAFLYFVPALAQAAWKLLTFGKCSNSVGTGIDARFVSLPKLAQRQSAQAD